MRSLDGKEYTPQEVALMTNQERVMAFGTEFLNKYIPQGIRTQPLEYHPALTSAGVQWLRQKQELAEKLGIVLDERMPREYIVPTVSFKEHRKEKVERKTTFKKSQLKKRRRSERVD